MRELDKPAVGRRIRQIRLAAGLRQWQLAKALGTTQSAIHKYEHGVIPEPKRLVELARIGGTSIEWVLTGSHWENGSQEQRRLSPELLRTAELLREVEDRSAVDQALAIVRDAVLVLQGNGHSPGPAPSDDPAARLREHSGETLQLLESASRIQSAVLRRVVRDAEGRLQASPLAHREKD